MSMFEDIFGKIPKNGQDSAKDESAKDESAENAGRPKIKVLDMTIDANGRITRGGDEPPPEVRAMLRNIIGMINGADPEAEAGSEHPLLKGLKRRPLFRKATIEEVQTFLGGIEELKVGDIVQHRGPEFEAMSWPEGLESAVVVRTFPAQFVIGGDNTPHIDRHTLRDCMILAIQNQDVEHEKWVAETEGREPRKPIYVEMSYDSRRLKKIGSIYDAKA